MKDGIVMEATAAALAAPAAVATAIVVEPTVASLLYPSSSPSLSSSSSAQPRSTVGPSTPPPTPAAASHLGRAPDKQTKAELRASLLETTTSLDEERKAARLRLVLLKNLSTEMAAALDYQVQEKYEPRLLKLQGTYAPQLFPELETLIYTIDAERAARSIDAHAVSAQIEQLVAEMDGKRIRREIDAEVLLMNASM